MNLGLGIIYINIKYKNMSSSTSEFKSIVRMQ